MTPLRVIDRPQGSTDLPVLLPAAARVAHRASAERNAGSPLLRLRALTGRL